MEQFHKALQLKESKPDEALQLLDELLQVEESLDALVLKGMICMGVGDWDEAVATLERGGQIDPGNERISNLLLLCHCEREDKSAASRERDRLFEHQNLTELERQQSEFLKCCSLIRGWWTDKNWGNLMVSGDSGIFSSLSRDWEGVLTFERATPDGHYQGSWESPKTMRQGHFDFRLVRGSLLQGEWKASAGGSSQLFFQRDHRTQL